jgi:hypothetical protein
MAITRERSRLKQGCQMVSFSDQKYQLGNITEDIGMENVDRYSGHFEYFMIIGYI